ncbi:MAG: hypothetical protein C4522_00380 [Desulfobacteraceae bacterium]|nr:MAG: hypothetical protein C4522_00380 [Desulfobacteraceae bacterium]
MAEKPQLHFDPYPHSIQDRTRPH